MKPGPDRTIGAGQTASDRWEIRDKSRYMALTGFAVSPLAEAAIAALSDRLGLCAQGAKPTSIAKRQSALAAMLADLMLAAPAGVWSHRSLDDHSFRASPVGRRAFRHVQDALEAAGYLETLKGYQGRGFGSDVAGPVLGRQTRFRATDALLIWMEALGIPVSGVLDHFAAGQVVQPLGQATLVLRGSRPPAIEGGPKPKAPDLVIDPADSRATQLRAEVDEINTFLRGAKIDGFAFPGLCRIFNDGDKEGALWRRGGRFYCLPGGGNYMAWRNGKAARSAQIRLEGEEVDEADISACHLSIFYGLMGEPFDHTVDPYQVTGVPRAGVKRWLQVALGNATTVPKNETWYVKVRKATMERHPILGRLEASGLSSLDFQYHESEILKGAMGWLRERSIPALPVHDSLVVPKSRREYATEALSGAFTNYFAVTIPGHPPICPRVP